MAKILNILRKLTRVQAREGLSEPHLLETLVAEDYLRKEGWSIDHTELESSEPHVIFVMEKEIPCCPAPHHFMLLRFYKLISSFDEFKQYVDEHKEDIMRIDFFEEKYGDKQKLLAQHIPYGLYFYEITE